MAKRISSKTKRVLKWQRDPAGMRQRILEAAKQEFAAHGLAGARVAALKRVERDAAPARREDAMRFVEERAFVGGVVRTLLREGFGERRVAEGHGRVVHALELDEVVRAPSRLETGVREPEKCQPRCHCEKPPRR